MKILLQPEAKTISDRELEINQKYLIDLFDRILRFASIKNNQIKDLKLLLGRFQS